MIKEVEQTESSFRDINRIPDSISKPKNEKDEKLWLLKTQDFQIWGPFSYKELYELATQKKLSRSDLLAKSGESFERLENLEELKDIINLIRTTNFDEDTDNNIIRDFTEEPTIKDGTASGVKTFLSLINFSVVPLNTVLWIILFLLVSSYCLYYVSRY